ncbi:prephenate dehydratase [Edaphobacter albus]|uniref:prephenate dehydratase n=1 Tax=Edaphobacter sp. 4G125 TaxID=2763071 RepID=UPI0016466F2C|nr:prephenate dehydratase domain-containing protein [Edaphobacter sp. 4G125]QNI38049.1 prephenate dehydratase [Edaphobacter sp. 4G125]
MKIAIQGELGSNSHMATLAMLGNDISDLGIVPCNVSAEVMARVISGEADAAVLPIENSLHGSVAEHYDLLLELDVRIERESLLRIRHNLITAPGVKLTEIRRVISHPVALSQCRKFLALHPEFEVMPFYDTAGSVKHVMEQGLRDVAGIAPELAATQYGGEILVSSIEDHTQNFTRFHLIRRREDPWLAGPLQPEDKMSLAFAIDHRPGTLVAALERLAGAGVNLTKIESRPVPGSPWEYVFYVDGRFDRPEKAEVAVAAMTEHCRMIKVLGRYRAAAVTTE